MCPTKTIAPKPTLKDQGFRCDAGNVTAPSCQKKLSIKTDPPFFSTCASTVSVDGTQVRDPAR